LREFGELLGDTGDLPLAILVKFKQGGKFLSRRKRNAMSVLIKSLRLTLGAGKSSNQANSESELHLLVFGSVFYFNNLKSFIKEK